MRRRRSVMVRRARAAWPACAAAQRAACLRCADRGGLAGRAHAWRSHDVKDGAPYRDRRRLDGRAHHDAPAAVQLLQRGRQLQPALLFARSVEKTERGDRRAAHGRAYPAAPRDAGAMRAELLHLSPLRGGRARSQRPGGTCPRAFDPGIRPSARERVERPGQPAMTQRSDTTKTHRRHRPGRGRPVGGARGGRGGARENASPLPVTLIDKAPEADAGGNTRWTPSYMRMASVDRVEPSFVHDMLEATQFQGDEDYFATLAAHAPATVQWIAAPRRAVPPAGLLSRQGSAAHPAGRRRRDHPPRAHAAPRARPASPSASAAPPMR